MLHLSSQKMPRSALTLKLNEAAHALGDKYYRCVTNAALSKGGFNDECIQSGRAYLAALETLREHLLKLEKGDEGDTLLENTDRYILLIRTDLNASGPLDLH